VHNETLFVDAMRVSVPSQTINDIWFHFSQSLGDGATQKATIFLQLWT